MVCKTIIHRFESGRRLHPILASAAGAGSVRTLEVIDFGERHGPCRACPAAT